MPSSACESLIVLLFIHEAVSNCPSECVFPTRVSPWSEGAVRQPTAAVRLLAGPDYLTEMPFEEDEEEKGEGEEEEETESPIGARR